MYCTQCGTQNTDQAIKCIQCQAPVNVPIYPSYSIENDAGMRILLPIGRSWWAIAAGYLGLFSLLILPAPLALICGIIGIIDIRKNPEKHGMGRCIFAVIIGGLFSALLLLFVTSALLA